MNPERINIKDLTIEEPKNKSELIFDPEKEIKPEYWDKYLKWFDRMRKDTQKDNTSFRRHLAILKVLNHGVDLSEAERAIVRDIKLTPNRDDLFYAIRGFEQAKILGENIDFPDSIARKVADEINSLIDEKNSGYSAEDIRALVEAGKGELIEERTKSLLREFLPKKTEAMAILNIALALKFLESEPALTSSHQQIIRNRLDSDEQKMMSEKLADINLGAQRYFDIAAELKLLSAEEISFGENGIEIKMPKKNESMESGASAMPEKRNF